MAVIIAGEPVEIPGVPTFSWQDDRRLRLRKGEDFRTRRTRWLTQIVLHTTKGIPGGPDQRPQQVLPGFGPAVQAGERCASYWSRDGRNAGAHLVIDHDGTVSCLADLLEEATFHAGAANEISIGIELYQGSDAELYMGQLEVCATVVDFLTLRFHIQRQTPHRYRGAPLERCQRGGIPCVGVFGHRDLTDTRGAGDPGSAIFSILHDAGYEPWNFPDEADVVAWKKRQIDLGIFADGVPGPKTVRALEQLGFPGGLWVPRPGDRVEDEPVT